MIDIRQMAEEMDPLLRMPAVPSELREKINSITEENALDLLRPFVNQICCRNASIVEYCPTLSGVLNCNMAPLLLGAGDTAKAAAM